MSESQNIQKVIDSEENRDAESSSPPIEADEDKQDSENREPDTPKSENSPAPRCDEPDKNGGDKSVVTKPCSAQSQRSLPESEQLPKPKVGECNLLPVLVERLRSALELSCSSQSSEDQLPLEDSGVDSEEDLRMWASNLQSTPDKATQDVKPNLDLKFLEDLLLSDIHTALAHLQDTLKRVDIGVLTRYNSSLDSTNKLNLLRLISKLLAKLKIPAEATVAQEKPTCQRRRRADRHTIGVSTEELARARKWLENNARVNLNPVADSNQESETQQIVCKGDKVPEKVKEKHIKDAINQQQSLQSRNRENEKSSYEGQNLSGVTKSGSKDDLDLLDSELVKVPPTYYNPTGTAIKHNKFTSKKAKIKRANTIDIPNYLKLQADYGRQNGCIALRRPIDISDKILSNVTNTVIPSFEPKTENDRKFLALINKNSESGPPITAAPFKSFSYRQTSSVADKNWNNRFSNIKTAFDKPKGEEGGRQNVVDEAKVKVNEEANLVIGSLRLPYGPAKQNQNGFRHAPTSPFQKIEKNSKDEATTGSYVKYGYTPKSGNGGLLQAKVKIFDHSETENANSPPVPPPRTKGPKFNKENAHASATKAMGDSKNAAETGNSYVHQKPVAPKPSRNSSEGKYNEMIKMRLSNSLDEGERRKEDLKSKRASDSAYQNMKRNSMSNYYEAQKRFSHPSSQFHHMYPVKVADKSNIPNVQEYQYNNRFDKKPKPTRVRRTIEEESATHREPYQKHHEVTPRYNPSKRVNEPHRPLHGSDIRVKNVAVQTGNETLLATPKEERVNVDYHRQYPEKEARTLCNNVSVQTVPEDPPSYALSNFLNELNNSNPHKAPVYYNRDLDLRRQSQHTPQTDSVYSPVASVSSYHSVEDMPVQQQVPFPTPSSPKVPYQEYIYPGKLSLPKIYTEQYPDQYNQFYPEPEKQTYIRPDYPVVPKPINRQYVNPNTVYYPPHPPPPQEPSYHDIHRHADPRVPSLNMYSPPMYDGSIEKKIQNQDIGSEGIVTRYTAAIGTIASTSASPESVDDLESRTQYDTKSPIYVYNEPAKIPQIQIPDDNTQPLSDIQRHNMLQQSLIKKFQSDQSRDNSPRRFQDARVSPVSPSFNFGKVGALRQSYEQPSDSHSTQDKINLFEEKRNQPNKLHFRPVNVPLPPKTHTLHPSKLVHPKFNDQSRSPVQQTASPFDTSDEYLMSCATKPSRIVLSKSESWHQLAMSKGSLQVPGPQPSSFQKPPKPKSPSSMRFSKQFEASSSSDNMKKMEEKVQQYFHGSSSSASIESKSKKRQLVSKKNFNALAKSHTMPHLYDEKIFDDNVDVDKAFDSLFKEATGADERF